MKKIVLITVFLLGIKCLAQADANTLSPKNVNNFLVDRNATTETQALFYNLKQLSKSGFAIGQQDAFNSFYYDIGGKSDIKKTTGIEPAIIGFDFSFITDNKNTGQSDSWFFQQEQKTILDVKKAYDQGMIITFCWHFREPVRGEEFYTDKMSDVQKRNGVKSILPGGEQHDYYKAKLDKIAAVSKKIKGSDGKLIPVIFRPFHEFDGNWFWWGADFCTPEEYKQLYIFTVEYLRDKKQVTNFLYAFSPDNKFNTPEQYLERYPGHNYVDVLGMDNYGDFDNKGEEGAKAANLKLKIISDLARENNKVAAMTETGYQITAEKKPIEGFFSKYIYQALTDNQIEIAYVLFWANGKNGYFVPQPNMPDTEDFLAFSKKPKAVLVNKLSSIYKLPKK